MILKKRSVLEAITKRYRSDKTIKKSEAINMISSAWNELSEYGIEPIPESGISSMQYQNIVTIAKKYTVEDILTTIERVKSSDFLQGKVADWKIDFNWFLKMKNYEKVRIGKYDGGNYNSGRIGRNDTKNISDPYAEEFERLLKER